MTDDLLILEEAKVLALLVPHVAYAAADATLGLGHVWGLYRIALVARAASIGTGVTRVNRHRDRVTDPAPRQTNNTYTYT